MFIVPYNPCFFPRFRNSLHSYPFPSLSSTPPQLISCMLLTLPVNSVVIILFLFRTYPHLCPLKTLFQVSYFLIGSLDFYHCHQFVLCLVSFLVLSSYLSSSLLSYLPSSALVSSVFRHNPVQSFYVQFLSQFRNSLHSYPFSSLSSTPTQLISWMLLTLPVNSVVIV